MKTAVIIDDQPYIRLIVAQVLQQEGIEVMAECSDGAQGLIQARRQRPDILVLELALPRLDGMEVITRLRRSNSSTRIVVLTACPAEFTVERCMRAGASAFISKSNDLDVFCKGIRTVRAGFTCFPDLSSERHYASHIDPDERTRLAMLSARELAVLRHLAMGLTNIQIGEALLLSNKTISSYKTRLVNKLKVRSVVCLADLARRHGVL
jgi:two-component system response regulator EvgA